MAKDADDFLSVPDGEVQGEVILGFGVLGF